MKSYTVFFKYNRKFMLGYILGVNFQVSLIHAAKFGSINDGRGIFPDRIGKRSARNFGLIPNGSAHIRAVTPF